jgi:hypothetical protein
VKDRQSYQPDGGSKNTADYDVLFILRVHRLIRLGYGRLQHVKYATCEETTITGDLVEAVEGLLDYPDENWMRFFSVYDDPPENQPKHRRVRRGRSRQRVDIRLDCSESSPRARFRFECKRLGPSHTAGAYLGEQGLGCFLNAGYAAADSWGGMLGYVQSENEQIWAARIEQGLLEAPQKHSLRDQSPWRHEPVIEDLPHTYRSDHGRGRGRRRIEIYHVLLRFW